MSKKLQLKLKASLMNWQHPCHQQCVPTEGRQLSSCTSNLFVCVCASHHRWGPGDIRGFWQRRCSHSPRRPGGGAITERAEPAEEEAGPDSPPRSHRRRRGRGRWQGWRDRLRLVAPLHWNLPSADQETPLTQHRSEAIPMSPPPVTLAAVHLFGSWTYSCNPLVL